MSAMVTILSPTVGGASLMPLRRVVMAYAAEVKCEALRMVRTPGLAIPFLLLPVPMYLFFGVLLPAEAIANNPGLANYLLSSWCVFTAMGPSMFGAGYTLASEREAGLFRLKRALPAPAGAWLIAKTVVAMVFAAFAVTAVVIAASVVGRASLSPSQLLTMIAVMTLGAIPFCALGLFIGARVSGASAPAIINVLFLPMLWLSGLFFPLPTFLERLVIIWPAFHLNQVAIGAAGIEGFSFVSPIVSAAVLLGITVLCGGLAIRRLARHG